MTVVVRIFLDDYEYFVQEEGASVYLEKNSGEAG